MEGLPLRFPLFGLLAKTHHLSLIARGLSFRQLRPGTDPLSNALLTTASTASCLPFRENRFLQWICGAMALAFLLAAYHPDTVFDWALENTLVFLFIPALIWSYRKLPLSDLSYLLILGYLCVHEFGAHYKYSDVPLGEWLKPLLHTQRNHYDRIAHFSFGLLLSYPMQEVFMRSAKITSMWRYYLPIECTLALSSIYEMLEAASASALSPQRLEEFVGMQGDPWDSQEDMLMAGLGSVVAMVVVYRVRKRIARVSAMRELAMAGHAKK
jgi:putative membrane protein